MCLIPCGPGLVRPLAACCAAAWNILPANLSGFYLGPIPPARSTLDQGLVLRPASCRFLIVFESQPSGRTLGRHYCVASCRRNMHFPDCRKAGTRDNYTASFLSLLSTFNVVSPLAGRPLRVRPAIRTTTWLATWMTTCTSLTTAATTAPLRRQQPACWAPNTSWRPH